MIRKMFFKGKSYIQSELTPKKSGIWELLVANNYYKSIEDKFIFSVPGFVLSGNNVGQQSNAGLKNIAFGNYLKFQDNTFVKIVITDKSGKYIGETDFVKSINSYYDVGMTVTITGPYEKTKFYYHGKAYNCEVDTAYFPTSNNDVDLDVVVSGAQPFPVLNRGWNELKLNVYQATNI